MSLTQATEPVIIPEARAIQSKSSVPKRAKLTAPQIATLRAASERDDRLVAFGDAPSLKTRKTVAGLLRRGLLVEVPAQAMQPSWREDEHGHGFSAAITQAGLAALLGCSLVITKETREVGQEITGCETGEVLKPPVSISAPSPSTQPGNSVSKRELIIALLRRQQGASVSEMMAVTGWLPHTTRAALTGLRHKGLLLDRSSREDGKAVYRIVEPAPQVLEPATQSDRAA